MNTRSELREWLTGWRSWEKKDRLSDIARSILRQDRSWTMAGGTMMREGLRLKLSLPMLLKSFEKVRRSLRTAEESFWTGRRIWPRPNQLFELKLRMLRGR